MFALSAETAVDYLKSRGVGDAAIRELSGGVSSTVLLVEPRDGSGRFVLKQALPQLKVRQEWLCSRERIWREVEVLRWCDDLLTVRRSEVGVPEEALTLRVPEVLFEDRENYCFAMTAAPAGHETWKARLLAGRAEEEIARACGRLLGTIHARSWGDQGIASELDDRMFFRDLRISPYFDRTAEVHASLADRIRAISAAIWDHRRCLVHGDFSPKNILIAGRELWLIDHEVGHFGDPAFDVGFFLTHLVLKTLVVRLPKYFGLIVAFCGAYDSELSSVADDSEMSALEERTIGALAGCLLARVDGKSPVEYLSPALAGVVRALAGELIVDPPKSLDRVLARVSRAIQGPAV
jgi:aminoglycoside phosphotransferase (APT) family kinase protein